MIPPKRRVMAEESTDSWLMSYADLITLLLGFFVIFVSVSEPKRDKFIQITQGLRDKFGVVEVATPFDGVYSALQFTIEENQIFKDMVVAHTERSLEIEIAGNRFFSPNSVVLDEENKGILLEIAKSLQTIEFMDYDLIVESHTSDLPSGNPLYPTNWEFSTMRAAKIVRFFAENGLPEKRMKATGYSDTHPAVINRDLQNNPIPENQEKNERIIIKLERK